MEFKDRIYNLRTERKMTQEQLASAIHTSRSAVASWEQGKRRPTYEMMEALSDYFNVSIQYLNGKDDVTPTLLSDEERKIIERYRGNSDDEQYYLDKKTQQYTEFLSKNPGHRVLFDASMKVSAEDVEKVAKMLGIFGEDNG